MTIPVFDRTLPALAEAVNHAAQVLRNIRDTSGHLSWRDAHDQRQRALIEAQKATQAVLAQMVEMDRGRPRIVDGNYVPIPANVAVVTAKLAGYPGAPSDGMTLLAQFAVVDAAVKALNAFYRGWYDGLPRDAKEFWASSLPVEQRPPYEELLSRPYLTVEQALPLRQSSELNTAIEAFEAVGG